MEPWRKNSEGYSCLCGKEEVHLQGILDQSGHVEKGRDQRDEKSRRRPSDSSPPGRMELGNSGMNSCTHSYSALRENSLSRTSSMELGNAPKKQTTWWLVLLSAFTPRLP